ncbi:MAG: hypothetical protein ABR915_16255 [Thermoguttaceae bacterium]|jgi:hypothetical protein
MADLKSETERFQNHLLESRQEAEKASKAADLAHRLASVHHREACRLRHQDAQAEYDRFDGERVEAKRQKEIWRAAIGAATKATDELRRVTDAILRIAVEAAEDERAIHELGESGLLPPARDVETLLDWLRQRNVTCWSGWEYIEKNISPNDRRELIQRLPHVAAGVLVASSDYERLADLFASEDDSSAYPTSYCIRHRSRAHGRKSHSGVECAARRSRQRKLALRRSLCLTIRSRRPLRLGDKDDCPAWLGPWVTVP